MVRKKKIAQVRPFALPEAKPKGIPIENVIEPFPLKRRAPMSSSNPAIAAQWFYKKNCGFGPEDFSKGSKVNVWWRCNAGPDHIWRQLIQARTSGQRAGNCPYCVGQRVSVTNSLATLFPEIAKQWHAKNGIKASDVTAYANYFAWWQCLEKHEWSAVINNRTSNDAGCPKCHVEGLRDFPEYLKYFDHQKNIGTDPMHLPLGKVVWWKCDRAPDHRWRMAFWKSHAEEACPFCRGDKASSTNNLTLANKLAREFHPTLNGKLRPEKLPLLSDTKVVWQGENCGHVWRTKVYKRYKEGSGCPLCAKARARTFIKRKL